MSRLFSAMKLLLLIGALISSAVAADSPLRGIPDKATYIVKIRNIDDTIQRWQDVVDFFQLLSKEQTQVVIPVDPVDDAKEARWGTVFRESIEAVFPITQSDADTQQDWWAFCWEVGEDDGKMAYGFLLPAEDPLALKASLDRTEADELETVIHERSVIWANRLAIDAIRQSLADEKKSIESRFKADTLAMFANSDLTVFVNLSQLKETSPNFAEETRDGLHAMLMSLVPTEIKPNQMKEILEDSIDQLAKFVLQGINDSESLTLSVTMDESEIRFEHFHSVKADSLTAAVFRDHPGTEMKSLSSLPANSVVYFACEGLQRVTTAWFTRFFESINAENEDHLSTRLSEIREAYQQLTYGTYAAGFPVFPIEQGMLRFVANCEVDKPTVAHDLDVQFARLGEVMSQKLAEIHHTPKPTSPTHSTERIGDQPIDVLQQQFPIQLQMNGSPVQKRLESLTLGPDGNITRTACLKDRIIDCVGGTGARTAAAIRRAADAVEGRPVSDPGFTRTRNQLQPKANLIVMLDLGGGIAAGMQLWNSYIDIESKLSVANQEIADADAAAAAQDEVAPIPAEDAAVQSDDNNPAKFDPKQIESMRAASAYVGLSVTLEPEGSRTKLVIPLAAIQNVVKLSASAEAFVEMLVDAF